MLIIPSHGFQTTFPKKIREQLSLFVSDALEWKVENGRIIVTSPQAEFLCHGTVMTKYISIRQMEMVPGIEMSGKCSRFHKCALKIMGEFYIGRC